MKITKDNLEKVLSERFFSKLKEVYLNGEIPEREEIIDDLVERLESFTYSPSTPVLTVRFDKGNGVIREVPIFNCVDYSVYYYCILELEKVLSGNRVKGTFGGWSIKDGLRVKEEKKELDAISGYYELAESFLGYTFDAKAFYRQYGGFNACLDDIRHELIHTSIIKTRLPSDIQYQVVCLDIANFYDSIRLDILENMIRSDVEPEQNEIVNLLMYFLHYWNRKLNIFSPQSCGLPQDYVGDSSRILANYYLRDFDKSMKSYCDKNNIRFLRYADDQVYFIPKKSDYKKLVAYASDRLAEKGLSLNTGKVKIWKNPKDFFKYRGFDFYDIIQPGKKQITEDEAKKYVKLLNRIVPSKIHNEGGTQMKYTIQQGFLKKTSRKLRQKTLKLLEKKYLWVLDAQSLKVLKKELSEVEWKSFQQRLVGFVNKQVESSLRFRVASFAKNENLTKLYEEMIKGL